MQFQIELSRFGSFWVFWVARAVRIVRLWSLVGALFGHRPATGARHSAEGREPGSRSSPSAHTGAEGAGDAVFSRCSPLCRRTPRARVISKA